MRKHCESCGSEFEAERSSRKYCHPRCRVRAYERRKSGQDGAEAPTPVRAMPVQLAAGPIEAATQAELDAADRLETAAGQSALALARRADAGQSEPGSSFAALVREHRAVLAEAVKDAKQAADPLDELRARRERRLSG